LLAHPEHGLGAMAQTRCQILVTHNQTHNADSRHRAPRDAAAQPRVSGKACPNSVLTARGTEGSNLLSSTGESGANLISGQIPSDFANAKRCTATCEIVAKSVDDLHSDGNKLSTETSLTERGTMVAGRGYTPSYHDVLTGSQADGRTFPQNEDKTCHNWTSSTKGTRRPLRQ
jgi:hypothetical protein